MSFRSIISIVIKGIAWLLLALFVGVLFATRWANEYRGIAIGGGTLLALAILGRWVGRRWVLKSARFFWTPAILLLLAGLVVSVRNTPLAILPIHIIALATAGLALSVALVGVLRYQGRAAMLRSVTVIMASLVVLVFIGLDATMSYRTETVVVGEETQLTATMSVPRGDGPFPVVLFVNNASPGLRSAWRAPADFMARRGFITVIWEPAYEDEGENSDRSLDPDLVQWVSQLGELANVDPDQIALWGVGADSDSLAAAATGGPDTVAAIIMMSPELTSGDPLQDFDGSVLVAFGRDDACNSEGIEASQIGDFLEDEGNRHRVLIYPEAGSGLLVWLTGETSCGWGIPPVSYPADYLDNVTKWLSESLGPAD